eukprot:NODE_48_length_31852_cov_1.054168.p18 type:complete len:209 gc:universal NODE_48_length_31852_cov_1.054168:10176-10802(+)
MEKISEDLHVHKVYNQIAGHFDTTRFAVWPIVKVFFDSIDSFSIGFDAGCGNGKYMKLRNDIFILGGDSSMELLKICKKKTFEVFHLNLISIPIRQVDFVLCIAVLHHLSTQERRIQVLKEFYKILKPHGRCLLFVWAKEQPKFKDSIGQDIMVPWHTKVGSEMKTYKRYYHLFLKGELESLVSQIGFTIINNGYDKGNWYVEISKPS